MAASAHLDRASRSAPSAGNTAMPTDGVTVRSSCPTWNGFCAACKILPATAAAPAASVSGSSNMNSSPPSRATVSCARTAAFSRIASSTSTPSPARCPRESLTSLKWSRSRNISATHWLARRAAPRACSPRSPSRARFGSPVSESKCASRWICASDTQRALRSHKSRQSAGCNGSRCVA